MSDDRHLETVPAAAPEVGAAEGEAVGEGVCGHTEQGDKKGRPMGTAGRQAQGSLGDRRRSDAEQEGEEAQATSGAKGIGCDL